MTTMDSNPSDSAGTAPRKRGAPKGNRNAWKHGGRSAAAKAAREAARAEIVARLPDAHALRPSLARAGAAYALLEGDAQTAGVSPNKTSNFVSPKDTDQGEGGARFSPNKTNNFVAQEGLRRRGAPNGNRNALKHGMKSAERRGVDADLRRFLRRLDAMCDLALAIAKADARRAP